MLSDRCLSFSPPGRGDEPASRETDFSVDVSKRITEDFSVRQTTGVAPHRYVLERRVERAKELLRQSDMAITEIAHLVGCSSHSHFSVLFNRIAGLTPRQFRTLT